MARATQLSVCLPNKPGQLAKLTEALLKAKVNIEALSVVDSADVCVVRLVASPVGAAKTAVGKLGATVAQDAVLLLRLPNEPGAIAGVARKLADAKINVSYVYGSGGAAGAQATVVVGVDDVAAAEKAL